MRVFASLALGISLISFVVSASAQPPAKPAPKQTPSPPTTSDLDSIRQSAAAFETAFNSGNAAAVAALWTEAGEYIDESGQAFKGRKAIEGEYGKIFAASKGQRIKIVIDSLKIANETTATEVGRAMLEPAPVGAPALGAYTATHTKVGGKWLMSKVQDTRVEIPSTYDSLADLEWLIGTWVAEEYGSKTESVCRWVGNKSFVQRSYTVTNPDQTSTSGVQLIGFNPQGRHLQSWNFSPDGSYAVGTWWPLDNGWKAELQGTLANGQITTATNLLTRLDDNAYVWQSIHRTVDGQSLPDTDEVVLKRQAN